MQSIILPKSLTISPGQSLTLSVNFPLALSAIQKELLTISQLQSFFRQNLTLQSANSKQYDVQLLLFGKIPIKKMHIDVLDPPMVVPCGHAIGVLVSSRGVIVVGHLPVTGVDRKQYYPAKQAGIKIGDVLLAMDGTLINNVEDVERFLSNISHQKQWLELTIKRQGKLIHRKIQPILTHVGRNKSYMLGIFIEDPAAGVGTLSFYNPDLKSFAGLGHQITSFGGRSGFQFQHGEIVLANISGIRAGAPGKPGEKIGIFNAAQNPIGKITKNCRFGIYGKMYSKFNEFISTDFFQPIPMAYSSQIHEGPAIIYTVLKGSKIEEFKVKIIKVYMQHHPRDKGLIIKVTDPRLLKETGGIIQGMSGSPIIQDGRLVGAVTHVFVNDPSRGYGVLAEWMMEEMNKSFKRKKAS